MRNLILRWVVYGIAIAVVAWLLPGIEIVNDDLGTVAVIALVFGILSALVKPVVKLLTCPLIILSLGLFLLVINGLMLQLTAALLPNRLLIDNFGWAILGGIVMGIVGVVLESVLGLRDDKDNERERRRNR